MPPKRHGIALVPAASRGVISRSAVSAPTAVQDAVARFERRLGGREGLIETLAVGESSAEIQPILYAIADPDFTALPLAQVCAAHGISPGELFAAVRKAALLRGQILAEVETATALPKVAKAVADLAVDHEGVCSVCDGTTTVVPRKTRKDPNPSPEPCTACKATGVQKIPASLRHQELVLELGKLLNQKGPGIQISQQNLQANLTPGSAAGSRSGMFDQLQQAVASILNGPTAPMPPPAGVPPADILDGTTIEGTDPPSAGAEGSLP